MIDTSPEGLERLADEPFTLGETLTIAECPSLDRLRNALRAIAAEKRAAQIERAQITGDPRKGVTAPHKLDCVATESCKIGLETVQPKKRLRSHVCRRTGCRCLCRPTTKFSGGIRAADERPLQCRVRPALDASEAVG